MLISDISVLIIVFFVGRRSCYFEADSPRLEELLLRGRFSLVELLFRDRFSVVGGLSRLLLVVGGLSRFLLVGWRIIFATACLAYSAGSSACCRSPI